jgi:hypothetical protein
MTKASTVDYSAPLVGFGRLATDAIAGLTDVVEAVHRQIAFPSRGLGPPSAQGFAAGIATLVYSNIRGVTRLVDRGLSVLAPPSPANERKLSPRHEAVDWIPAGFRGATPSWTIDVFCIKTSPSVATLT